MNTEQQLTEARADLTALQADTPKLQQLADENEARLSTARQGVKKGDVSFTSLPAIEGQALAARGLLDSHLAAIEEQRALVVKLASADEDERLEGALAAGLREYKRLEVKRVQLLTEAEEHLRDVIAQYNGLTQLLNEERGRALRAFNRYLEKHTVTTPAQREAYRSPGRLAGLALLERVGALEYGVRDVADVPVVHSWPPAGNTAPLLEQVQRNLPRNGVELDRNMLELRESGD